MRTKGDGPRLWVWIAGPALAVILLAVLVGVLRDEESAGPNVGVTLYDITNDPDDFYGSTVTISSEINDILGQRSFTIGGDELLADELLVVSSAPLAEVADAPGGDPPEEGDVVQVTGEVREFKLSGAEDEIGADLNDELLADWVDTPSIVATSISVTPDVQAADENVPVTLSDLTSDPGEFYGRAVTIDGVVAETVEPSAFALADEPAREGELDPAEEGVLVVSADPALNLIEDRPVQVIGVFQEFDLEIFEEELGVELDDEAFADWDGRPAILAAEVVPAE